MPILDLVPHGVEKIIVTSYELVLRYASDAIKTKGNDLAFQFLEGVQFTHQRNVAHLDLKPDNIVLRTTTHTQRLLLIDFSVSVQVSEQESWIEGYRGTEDWAAPESTLGSVAVFNSPGERTAEMFREDPPSIKHQLGQGSS